MWSTRARLAAAYAGLLFVTLVAFCAAVFVARRASAIQELAAFGQQGERLADEVLRVMAAAEASGKHLTTRDSARVPRPRGDSTTAVDTVWTDPLVSPLPELRTLLE